MREQNLRLDGLVELLRVQDGRFEFHDGWMRDLRTRSPSRLLEKRAAQQQQELERCRVARAAALESRRDLDEKSVSANSCKLDDPWKDAVPCHARSGRVGLELAPSARAASAAAEPELNDELPEPKVQPKLRSLEAARDEKEKR